jgi:hypothetical protein
VDPDLFRRGLDTLGTNFGREILPAVADLYWAVLSDAGVRDGEFAVAVQTVLREDLYFPPVARLLALAHPKPDFAAEAAVAEAEIEHLGTYHYAGYTWSRSVVERNLGPAALAAFDAVGGSDAWKDRSYQYRHKTFVETYTREREREWLAAQSIPTSRRLSGGVLRLEGGA